MNQSYRNTVMILALWGMAIIAWSMAVFADEKPKAEKPNSAKAVIEKKVEKKKEEIKEDKKKVVWHTDFAKAKALAKKNKRPILANFSGSDWCIWCHRLENEVFSKKEFKKYAGENLVLLLVDFPMKSKQPPELAAQNEKLAEALNVRGFPTIHLLDADGKVLGTTGYQRGGAEKYVKHIEALLKKAELEKKKQKKNAVRP